MKISFNTLKRYHSKKLFQNSLRLRLCIVRHCINPLHSNVNLLPNYLIFCSFPSKILLEAIGQVLQGRSKVKKFLGPEHITYCQLNIFFLQNSLQMEKWMESYNEAMKMNEDDQKKWRIAHHRQRPCLS